VKPRNLLADNLVLKGMSVLLATGAWFLAQGDQIYRATIEAPVDYLMPEASSEAGTFDLILMNDVPPPKSVRLQVSGSRGAVNRLSDLASEVEVRYVVDLREAEPGRAVHSFLRPPSGVPRDVAVDTVSPAEVEIEFDRVTSVKIPVRVQTRGRLPTGFVETSRQSSPANVTLTGSRRDLMSLDFIQTLPIDLDDVRGDFDEAADLDLGQLQLLPTSPRSVQARLRVSEAHAEREFPGIAIQVAEQFGDLNVTPSTAVLRLHGPVPVLESLGSERVAVHLDGDAAQLIFPDEGPVLVGYSPSAVIAGARPAVRISIDHPRANEIELRGVEPLSFRVSRKEAAAGPSAPGAAGE